jgi:predicted GNAT family acetyltransferase
MYQIKEFNGFLDYKAFSMEYIEGDPFLYFNLEKTFKRVLHNEVQLIRFFNVVGPNNFITVLLVKNECLIYASDVNDEITLLVAQGLEFDKFKRYTFFGTKNIIDSLFSKFDVEYSEQKHRIFYECNKISESFQQALGEVQMANEDDLLELVEFGNIFVNEFYGEEKPPDNVFDRMLSGVKNRNIFCWVLNTKLVCIAQVNYDEFNFPVICHVISHPNSRNIGVASSLVYNVTKGLIENGHNKCLLMTNAYNPASNKAFQRVGYNITGEYVVRYKEI